MGRDDEKTKLEGRKGDLVAYSAALIAATVSFAITSLTILKSHPSSAGWFALHPPLQTLAVLIFTGSDSSADFTTEDKSSRFETSPNCCSFHCISMYCIWNTFGGICMLWILIQISIGVGSVWFDGAAFGGGSKAKAIWKYHRLSGYFLFSTLMLTTHLGGGWSNWGVKHNGLVARLVVYTIAPMIIVGSVFGRIRSLKMKIF